MTRKIRCPELPFTSWGGARPGAGRPKKKNSGVPHARRATLSRHHPAHVTLRLQSNLPSLRRKGEFQAILAAIHGGKDRFGFRLNRFAVMSNHMHLIIEADDRKALSLGMQGLVIRIARALNRLWQRRGRVFLQRFHAHILRTPTEVRRALRYVANNARIHGIRLPGGEPDPFSSDAWSEDAPGQTEGSAPPLRTAYGRPQRWFEVPVVPPRTWLLRLGWLRGKPRNRATP